jgi:hypothetical protein
MRANERMNVRTNERKTDEQIVLAWQPPVDVNPTVQAGGRVTLEQSPAALHGRD